MKRTPLAKLLALSLGLALSGISPLEITSSNAATLSWDANSSGSASGGTGTWTSGTANWFNGTADQTWTDTTGLVDTAVFGGTAGTVTLGSNQGALGLVFKTTGYTLQSGTLTLGSSGINASALTTGTTTISSNLTLLPGYQSWTVGTGGKLAINGAVARGTGAAVNFSSTGVTSTTLANDSTGILGGWATTGNSGGAHAIADFAANDGSGNIGTYTGYTLISTSTNTSQTLSASTVTQNWKTSNSTSSSDGNGWVTTLTNSGTINSLVVQGDVVVGSGNTLTLGSGGLILSGISRWIKAPGGATSDTGMLTSGLARGELFVDVAENDAAANNWRIWTKIVDNNGTPVSVVKTGPGLLELANTNTYTGNTYVNAGSLAVGITNALGTSGTLYLNGATLTNGGASAQVNLPNNIVIFGNSAIQCSKNGTVQNFQLTGTMSGSGVVTFGNDGNNISMYIQLTNTMTSGTVSLANWSNVMRMQTANFGNANLAWVFNNTTSGKDTLEFNGGTISFGSLAGNGYITGNAGTSTQTISVGNLGYNDTFSGIINQNSGDVITLQKVGSGTLTLTGANAFTGGVQLNGGKINVGSSGALNNTGAISFGGGTLQYSAVNQTDYSSRLSTAAGQAYSVDTNGQTVTWASALASSGGSLAKSGSGTLILSGTSTYSGLTAINSGSLRLTGILSSSGSVSLGAATLQGSGSAGAVVVNNSSATLANGNGVAGSTSALTLGSLTFNTPGTLTLSKFNDTGTVALAITGALTTTSGITLNVPTAPAWVNGQTYDLISYGSFSGNLSDFNTGTIAGLGARQSATLGSTGAGSGFITLAIAGDTPYWTGAEDNNWTLTSGTAAKNWKLVTAQTATDFLPNDQVLFDDNATGSTNVNISSANVGVAAVTFNNSSKNYTISSTGGFGIVDGSAAASLSVLGTGTVTLTTNNGYTGVTTLSAGQLQLGDGATNGDIASSSGIVNNASLVFNRTAGSSFTYANVISGTGSVTMSGSGRQILTGANSYSGGTTINSGTLQLGNGGTVGALSGSGTITNNSSLVFNRSNSITQGTDFGKIVGTGSVIQSGSGSTTLSGANSYTGGTIINAGILVESNNSAFGTGPITLNGGSLNNSGADTAVTNTIIVGSGGGTIALGNGAGNLTLSGTLSGAGNLTLGISTLNSLNFNFVANTMTSGTITTAATGNDQTVFRFNSTAATSSAIDWVFNGAGNRANFLGVSGTYQFGSLAGSGIIWDNFLSGQNLVLSIGGNNHDATFGGTIRKNSATISVVKNGTGTETFSGANTYDGGTTLNAGTLAFGNSSAFGSGALTLNAGTLKAAGAYTLANNIAVAGAATLDMASNNTGLSGALSGTGALTLNNSGNAATLTLSGSNSAYAGTFTVNNNNAFSITSANAGSANAAWVFNDSNVDRVRINVSGTNTLNFGSISGNGQIQNDTASSQTTLSVGALGTNSSFGGTINDGVGVLALNKTGAGSLTLSGNNTYSGGTTVNGGTLNLNGVNSGNGAVNVSSGATLGITGTYSGGGAVTVNGTVTVDGSYTGAGTVTVNNGGTVTVNGSKTGSGAVTVNSGATLNGIGSVSGPVTVGGSLAGSLTLTSDATINTGATAAATAFNGNIVNNGTITSDLTLAAGKTLSGIGQSTGAANATAAGSVIAPGNSGVGNLTVGSLNTATGAHLSMDILGTTAGSYDTITVSSSISLSGGDLTLNLGSFTPGAETLFLIDNSLGGAGANFGTLGNFDSITFTGSGTGSLLSGTGAEGTQMLINGTTYTLTYGADFEGISLAGGNDVALIAAVPEPSTWAMMLGGLGTLLAFQRNRRRK